MMKISREKKIILELVQHLKLLRLQNNWSHTELGRKAGVTRPAISQIENAKRVPTLLVCLKIAHALGVGLGDLIAKCEQEPGVLHISEKDSKKSK